MLKENKGVTLVALVITIIVLLILAGVTLSMVMGDSGIFSKANKASTETTISSAKDDYKIQDGKIMQGTTDTKVSVTFTIGTNHSVTPNFTVAK